MTAATSACRLDQTLLRESPRSNSGHECVADCDDGGVEQVMTEAQRIRACGDRADGTLFDADGRADRLHLECVRDDEPSESEVAAQDVVEDLPAHRGGRLAERPYDDVRGHDRLHARGDGRAERLECDVLDRLDHRKREVRVDRGVAVAGEVLGASRDPRTLQPADERGDVSSDERRRPRRTSGSR